MRVGEGRVYAGRCAGASRVPAGGGKERVSELGRAGRAQGHTEAGDAGQGESMRPEQKHTSSGELLSAASGGDSDQDISEGGPNALIGPGLSIVFRPPQLATAAGRCGKTCLAGLWADYQRE